MSNRKWKSGFALSLTLTALVGCSSTDEPKEAKLSPAAQVKAEAIAAVKDGLKDPFSAEFRNVKVLRGVHIDYSRQGVTMDLRPEYVVCGEVNAKNGMGGYAGWRAWTTLEGVPFFEGGDGTPEGLVEAACDLEADGVELIEDDAIDR